MKVDELTVNTYGNVDCVKFIPDGFVTTMLSVSQLKKINVDSVKCCIGFDGMPGYRKPILRNLISKADEEKVLGYKQQTEKPIKKNLMQKKVFEIEAYILQNRSALQQIKYYEDLTDYFRSNILKNDLPENKQWLCFSKLLKKNINVHYDRMPGRP